MNGNVVEICSWFLSMALWYSALNIFPHSTLALAISWSFFGMEAARFFEPMGDAPSRDGLKMKPPGSSNEWAVFEPPVELLVMSPSHSSNIKLDQHRLTVSSLWKKPSTNQYKGTMRRFGAHEFEMSTSSNMPPRVFGKRICDNPWQYDGFLVDSPWHPQW